MSSLVPGVLLGFSMSPTTLGIVAVVGALGGALALSTLGPQRVSKLALGGGWFLFALTSPSSQFPVILRPLGLVVAGVGAGVYRLSRDPRPMGPRRPPSPAVRLLLVFVAFVLLGCLASPYGARNLGRGVEGIIVLLAGLYGVSMGLSGTLLAGVFAASATNVALTLISGTPQVLPGSEGRPERLSGYMHPNHLAFAAGVVLIGVIWCWRRHPRFRLPLAVIGACNVYVLLASRSRTGLGAVAIAIGIAVVASATPRARAVALPLVFAAGLVLVPLTASSATRWLSRDDASSQISSLTGRTDLWPHVIDLIRERPIVGWGVNVELSPAGSALQTVIPGVGQAHDAYLEAALIGGIPGALAWGASLAAVTFGAWHVPRSDERRFLLIAGSLLLQVYAITESSPAWFGDMFLIYVLVVAIQAQARKDADPLEIAAPAPRERSTAGSVA